MTTSKSKPSPVRKSNRAGLLDSSAMLLSPPWCWLAKRSGTSYLQLTKPNPSAPPALALVERHRAAAEPEASATAWADKSVFMIITDSELAHTAAKLLNAALDRAPVRSSYSLTQSPDWRNSRTGFQGITCWLLPAEPGSGHTASFQTPAGTCGCHRLKPASHPGFAGALRRKKPRQIRCCLGWSGNCGDAIRRTPRPPHRHRQPFRDHLSRVRIRCSPATSRTGLISHDSPLPK